MMGTDPLLWIGDHDPPFVKRSRSSLSYTSLSDRRSMIAILLNNYYNNIIIIIIILILLL